MGKIFWGIFAGLFWAAKAKAVPPPDFIFNLGSQIAQVFSILFMTFSFSFGIIYQLLKKRLAFLGKRKYVIPLVVAIVGVSFGVAYMWGKYEQKKEYKKWLESGRNGSMIADPDFRGMNE